jgi:hypothetical protein
MSKRTSKPNRVELNLDDELARRSPRPPGLAIKKDNWKVSADKATNDPDWNKAKKSLGLGSSDLSGFWEYSTDGKERSWVRKDDRAADGSQDQTSSLISHGPFPAHEGDREISRIYRKFWLKGDASAFIDTIYQ